MPNEFIAREITEFILLPIRHISLLNDLLQSVFNEQPSTMNSLDGKIIEGKQLKDFNGFITRLYLQMFEFSPDKHKFFFNRLTFHKMIIH